MNCTVLWQPVAEQQLAALWAAAVDRKAIQAAADAIDDLLRRNPLAQGESCAGAERLFFLPHWSPCSPSMNPIGSCTSGPFVSLGG